VINVGEALVVSGNDEGADYVRLVEPKTLMWSG
jgi:hypothetical protein